MSKRLYAVMVLKNTPSEAAHYVIICGSTCRAGEVVNSWNFTSSKCVVENKKICTATLYVSKAPRERD
jgi:hypothetical protein